MLTSASSRKREKSAIYARGPQIGRGLVLLTVASLTVAYLHNLSGSQTKRLRKFKENLAQALRDLQAAGAIKAFEIQDDLVHVWTAPSLSQQRHLAARRPPGSRRRK